MLFNARHVIVMVTLVVVGCARALGAENLRSEQDLRELIDGYRTWKGISAQPIFVPAVNLAACAAAIPPNTARGPHADGFIQVYVNPAGRKVFLAAGTPRFTAGTVIVKEKLTSVDDDHPRELGIMIKRPRGFDPSAGDWQFAFVDADDRLITEPKQVADCRTCHQVRAQSDYVFRKSAATAKAGKAKPAPRQNQ